MSKKNWFLTKNDTIHDLNRFLVFGIGLDNTVYGYIGDVMLEVALGYFKDHPEADAYLKTIYNQLWDEEYRSLGGEDGDN